MFNRGKYYFRYFFNAGYDKSTNECDLEGSDVFELDDDYTLYIGDEVDYSKCHYIGMIKWVLPSEISDMEDDEVEDLFINNNILY